MLPPLDYASYREWVKQFFERGTVTDEEFVNGLLIKCSYQLTPEMIAANKRAALRLAETHIQEKAYRHLACLGEFLREKGHFYGESTPETGKTLELLLRHTIDIVDNGEVFNDIYILLVSEAVYDIVFHQVRFEEYGYPPVCEELYDLLTQKLLDPAFAEKIRLKREEIGPDRYRDGYDESLVFINYDIAFNADDEDDNEEDASSLNE